MNDYDSGSGNEQRFILTILLCLGVLWLWTTFVSPPPPAAPVESAVTEPTSAAPATGAPETIAGQGAERSPDVDEAASSLQQGGGDVQPEGFPAATKEIPEQILDFASDDFLLQWTTRGGGLKALKLAAYKGPYTVVPLYIWLKAKLDDGPDEPWKPYEKSKESVILLTDRASFLAAGTSADDHFEDGDYELVSHTGSEAVFQRVTQQGVRITKRYLLGPASFQGRVELRFENMTEEPLDVSPWIGVADSAEGKAGRYSNVTRPGAVVDGSWEHEDNPEKILDNPVVYPGPVSWFGIASRYFVTALLPDEADYGQVTFVASSEDYEGVYLVASSTELRPDAPLEYGFNVYAGPKELKRLQDMGQDLDKAVNFGIFGFFSKILLWLLQILHTVVGNWGVAIIGLTLLVKGLFFPLTQKAFRSAKEMQRLQPMLNEMKEKYKDNKEMQTQETMRLFKEHGVNPMGGCLPTLIQLPVWFALYSVLLFAVDLYHSRFLVFLDLSEKDPYMVLPIIVGVLMFLQQRMTPMTGMDPTQAKMMRLMPLIFVFFIFSFPSGLALYICVNSVLTIFQQWLINRNYRKTLATSA